MSLVKSNKRRTPVTGASMMLQDPFFTDLFDPRRGLFNLNRFINTDSLEQPVIPAINVKDLEKNYEIHLAAPGLSKKDFNVTIDNGILTITAEKESKSEQKEDDFVRKEFSYNSFSRSMSLPDTIDEDKEVKAKYEDGVLKLILNKKEGLQNKTPKTIKIS